MFLDQAWTPAEMTRSDDRCHRVDEMLVPALERGNVVIIDNLQPVAWQRPHADRDGRRSPPVPSSRER